MAELPTKDRLANALHSAGIHELARDARKGMFDDFLSQLPKPKTALVEALEKIGNVKALALAERVRNGEFDNTAREARHAANARGQGAQIKRHIYSTDGEH